MNKRLVKESLKASVIIAVYKDVEALNCIFWGLEQQTEKSFEVIVAEDGQDSTVASFIDAYKSDNLRIEHLTQEDIGFRKTRAANRAVLRASSSYLIFIDGDCIPHPTFVEMHLKNASQGVFLAGRRMHLGKSWSNRVRKNPCALKTLFSPLGFLMQFFYLHFDGVRNYEIGNPSNLLNRLLGNKHVSLIGCNFSLSRDTFYAINGYDEDLTGVGGEDGDLEWRLNMAGIFSKSVKFQAIVYHLFHKSRRENAETNANKSITNRRLKKYKCSKGIEQHFSESLLKK